MHQILIATHNPSKIKRLKDNFNLENVEFVSPIELSLKIKEPKEDGQSEWENAKIKATAYYEIAKIPSLSLDTGFYLNNLADDKQPGKDVQGSAGVLATDDDETRNTKMITYYQSLVAPFGEETPAYFKDVYCLFDGKKYFQAVGIRDVILTKQVVGKDVHFPITSLFKAANSNKFYHELDSIQMLAFIQPNLMAVMDILTEAEYL